MEGGDGQITTSGKRKDVLQGSIRPDCSAPRICAADSATRRSCGGAPRFPVLHGIFCALRRLDLHADRKADRCQQTRRHHCEFPRSGLHVSGHSRYVSVANLSGGNMQGSCEPPGPGQIWSAYQLRPDIPQALTNWDPTLPEAFAPPQVCPASLNLGNQYAQCFSMSCDTETYINNVPVVTCHCAIGATLNGTPASPNASFPTQAGQRNQAFCFQHPVGNVLSIPSP